MNLAIVIPTRCRLWWLKQQVKLVAAQMQGGDHLIIVIDCDEVDEELMLILAAKVPDRFTVVHLYYARASDFARVNYARNVGSQLAPKGSAIVEIDDHDFIKPGCLDAIRVALDDGAIYCFGDCSMNAILETPSGKQIIEQWPDMRHTYTPGGFERGEIECIGVRAIRGDVWQAEGGWSLDVFPGGDFDLAKRIEANAPSFVRHIPQPLCTVLVEPESLSASHRETDLMPKASV